MIQINFNIYKQMEVRQRMEIKIKFKTWFKLYKRYVNLQQSNINKHKFKTNNNLRSINNNNK